MSAKTKSKKKTIREYVHEWAKSKTSQLRLGNYELDFKLFEDSVKDINVRFDTFKYYMREITDPTFSRYNESEGILTQVAKAPVEKIKLFSMSTYNPDPKLFVGMETGKPIDLLVSKVGGFMPGTTNVLDGGPGAGKTTVATDVLAALKKKYPKKKFLYVNGEMKPLDLAAERMERPSLNMLNEILLLATYSNKKRALEEVLAAGWDLVVIDSVENIVAKLAIEGVRRPEHYLIELMDKHNDNKFDTGFNTSFLALQQVTKEGIHRGSNSLKHDTTGFLHCDVDGERRHFIWAEKNRRNGADIHRSMYFDLIEGDVVYDLKRWEKDINVDRRALAEREQLLKEEVNFAKVFGTTNHASSKN